MLLDIERNPPKQFVDKHKQAGFASPPHNNTSFVFQQARLNTYVLTRHKALFDSQRNAFIDQICQIPKLIGEALLIVDAMGRYNSVRFQSRKTLLQRTPEEQISGESAGRELKLCI
jgi:hypothetical protein